MSETSKISERAVGQERERIAVLLEDEAGRCLDDIVARALLAAAADVRALSAPPVNGVNAELVEALKWYGEQARLCRLVHSEGDKGRHALAEDGGKRARAALEAAALSAPVGEGKVTTDDDVASLFLMLRERACWLRENLAARFPSIDLGELARDLDQAADAILSLSADPNGWRGIESAPKDASSPDLCPWCGSKLGQRVLVDSDDRIFAKWRACDRGTCIYDERKHGAPEHAGDEPAPAAQGNSGGGGR